MIHYIGDNYLIGIEAKGDILLNRISKLMNNKVVKLVVLTTLGYLLFITANSRIVPNKALASNLNVTNLVMQYVKRYYVNQDVVEPKQLLISGLGKLERVLDQVLIEFPDGEDGPTVTVQVVDAKTSFDMSQVSSVDDVTSKLEQVFEFVAPKITTDEPKMKDVEYAVVDEMLKSLDTHSGIITPQVYKEFMIETEGSFGGLGIVIGIRDGELTVIAPIEGTPAYKAGIKSNDKIVQIEDESTINMSLIQAVSKLRGKKGTPVNIAIKRENNVEPKYIKIIRDTIKIESVETFELDNDIQYVRIRDFQKNTLDSILDNLNNGGPGPKGIILDLRGNPGGLLDQANKVSDLFLKEGVIVTTKAGKASKPYLAKNRDYEFDGNVVVLVDSGSASASEIVAGALKNNERAIIIGERTFGKGSVQQIFDLNDGSALKLTIAKYYTPGDKSIQDIGVTPDIILNPTIVSKNSSNLNLSSQLLTEHDDEESKQTSTPLEIPTYSITYLENNKEDNGDDEPTPEEALSRVEKRNKLESDFYVSLAKNILGSSSTTERRESLGEIKKEINRITQNEEVKIEDKWQNVGVDWSYIEATATKPVLDINIVPKNPAVNAGGELSLTVEVENKGADPIYRLMAKTESKNPLLGNKEFIFGKIEPGEKKIWSTTFELPKWILTRMDKIDLKFTDANESEFENYSFNLSIKEQPRPLYSYNYEIVDDGRLESVGNGNGIAEFGETVALLVNVNNIGQGISEKSVLTLKNLSEDTVFLNKGRFQFENLEQGKSDTDYFTFTIKDPKSDVELELQIIDDTYREGVISKITLPSIDNPQEITKSDLKYRVLKNNTPIRGGGYTQAPIIAIAEEGTIIDSVAENDDWIKISLKDSNSGWINKKKVMVTDDTYEEKEEAANGTLSDVFEAPPIINIDVPPVTTSSPEISLVGDINDTDGIDLISVYVGDDKVALLHTVKQNVPVSFKLKLLEDINLITIIAKDSKGLLSKQSFVVRKEEQPKG